MYQTLRLIAILLVLLVLIVDLRNYSEASSADQQQPQFVLEWGKPGEGPGEFHSPIGLVFNSKDELFVTDLNNARIQKFSSDGEYLEEFALPPDTPDRKSTMIGGIAIDKDELLYLTYMIGHKVAVYRQSGEFVRQWGTKGNGNGQLNQPGGIIVAQDGTLLIADQGNHRIQRFTPDGDFLGQWGGYGEANGRFGGLGDAGSRFGGPHVVASDSRGRVYATAGFSGHVQQFSQTGEYLNTWGNKSDEPGGFGGYALGGLKVTVGPIGIAVDRHDRVLVSSLNDRVQYYDTDGKYLFGIEGTGKPDGQLLHPHGMAFDREGFLYIADAGNQRIVKFWIPAPQIMRK